MFGYLLMLFTLVPALELYVLLKVGAILGAGTTLLILLSTGIAGASLARWQGLAILEKTQNEINRGMMPSTQLMDGLMILAAGILLLTPGFITDILGILLLIPWCRSLFKFWLKRKFERMIQSGQVVHFQGHSFRKDDYTDIDVG